MTPLLYALEIAMIAMASFAFLFACLLIRAAGRPPMSAKRIPHTLPSTPLTRKATQRKREYTLV